MKQGDVTMDEVATTTSSITAMSAGVSCGCNPSAPGAARRHRRRFKLRKNKYHEAMEFDLSESSEDGFWYFDAEEDELGDTYYPIIVGEQDEQYVSKKRAAEEKEQAKKRGERGGGGENDMMDYTMGEPSQRYYSIVKAPVQDIMRQLAQPKVYLEGNGYPGSLDENQLNECRKFLQGLTDVHASVVEQIYSFRDVEPVPFTVCRWVRAMKWDAAAILKRCEENQPLFDNAQKHQFFPDPSVAMGAPFPVFLSQYPMLPIGKAKNGCMVNYFGAGKINPEGILALTSIPQLEGYFWWSFMHKMKAEMRKAQEVNPDFIRCEGINIIDLQGLSRAALQSETMSVIKMAAKVSDFFPETLNQMLILNAPGFFGMAWGLIKNFIDPQTARRIQLFSNKEQGLKALQQLVDIDQIPRDYGGGNISIAEAFLREANDPSLLRQEIELIHVKRRGNTTSKKEWVVKQGEHLDLKCFTRSASAARISVKVNGSTNTAVNCQMDISTEPPKPASRVLASKVKGPCTVTLEFEDMDNVEKNHQKLSRGYFLVVGDVKRPLLSMRTSSRNQIPISAEKKKEPVSLDELTSISKEPMNYDDLDGSQRFKKITGASVKDMMELIKNPRINVNAPGFPGNLTQTQLNECEKFLTHMPEAIYDHVWSLRDVEEPAFTVCRWVRGMKWDAMAMIQRCSENQPRFDVAKSNNFYPDVGKALGASFPAFLSQYPFIPLGHGKKGNIVSYFQAGRINPEGVLAMTTFDKMEAYYWWGYMHKLKQDLRKNLARDPDLVRHESLSVIDLQGLSRAALSGDTMDCIKLSSKIGDYYPETLNQMFIINAPGFFSMAWGLIKKFIDPQTAARIKLFSNKEQGLKALREVIDTDQLPKDYGGTNISFEEAMRGEANDPCLLRQIVELIHVRNKGVATAKKDLTIKSGEYMVLTCYTRSVSGSTLIVFVNGEMKNQVRCQSSDGHASLHMVAEEIKGPATVSLEVQDLHNVDKSQSKMSRGYFLIAADFRKPGGATDSTPPPRAKATRKPSMRQRKPSARQMAPLPEEPAIAPQGQGQAGRKPISIDPLAQSERLQKLTSAPLEEMMKRLTNPRIGVNRPGYPGSLTPEQLNECKKFVMNVPESIRTQIWSLRDVEEPEYTIVRWVRATKWDAAAIIKRCEENHPRFQVAEKNQFYPDVGQALGASFPAFLTQYPFIPLGYGKSGMIVSYFQAGRINPEGVLAMTTFEKMEAYYWWGYMHKLKQDLRKNLARDPDLVRHESLSVIDLQGLSRAALSGDTMDCIKLSSKIGDYYPETLNQMFIINAPGFFSMAWGLIKKFIDPQTAARIKLFSNKEQGLKALREVIDEDQLPKDYGGRNISFEEAMRVEANDPSLLRQVIDLIHVRNRGVATSKKDFNVRGGEHLYLSCYTRSVSGSTIIVFVNGEMKDQVICQSTDGHASSHIVAEDIKGPATISIEVQDLHNVDKRHNKMSRGYFVMVADYRKPGASSSTQGGGGEAPAKEVSPAPEPKIEQVKEEKKSGSKDIFPLSRSTPLDLDSLDHSERYRDLTGASVEDKMKLLTHPRVCIDKPGYPGCLSDEQLGQCRKFLTDMPESIYNHIWSVRDVEDPGYTICRWVRATKWDAEAILKRCQENQPQFEEAQKHKFYPDASAAINAPFPAFLTQYPQLPIGRGKNGCIVTWFQAGRINPEGVLAMTTVEKLEGFYWWGYMHKMKSDLRRSIAQDPDWVRCEGINVIDLQGLSRAALSSETMACIQLSSKIGDFFPETLNQMLVINVPGFFKLAWGIIKKFVDPQTARRIKLYSSKEEGLKALREIIDVDQLPSDYGGTNISFEEGARNEANEPSLIRLVVELIHVKNKGKADSKKDFTVKSGESLDLKCYTRSVSGGTILVSINGEMTNQVGCQGDHNGEASSHVLASKVEGPATISLEVQDLNNADKKHNKLSRGYFLIAGEYRTPGEPAQKALASRKPSVTKIIPIQAEEVAPPVSQKVSAGAMVPMRYDQPDASERFYNITDAPIQAMMQQLSKPRVLLDGDGYPGRLTKKQLDECQKFLKNMPESIQDQIYSFRDVEEPAFTVCRWVRAMKWDAMAILKRCQENQAQFENAKKHQFFPDPSKAIGAPFPVYLSQYPFLPIGRAKNGCSVNYFGAGRINPEGILALTTVEELEGYFWWSFMHKMKSVLRETQTMNPDHVRCEGVNVIDLQGLSRAALSSDTMAVIKLASKISDFFPETLNGMLILNAPGFFGMAWGIIKKFIDPQTAKRIRLYSNKEQGLKALQEMVDIDQIPKDYGGRNKSMAEAFLEEANDPNLLRQEIELMYIRRKGKAISKKEWDVQKGEYIELKCYTRSCSGATVNVVVNSAIHNTVNEVYCDNHDDGTPKAACHILANKIQGPCSVSLEVQDLDNANKKHNGLSRGYFLCVGDIRPADR